jgi:hypothetical protein
MLLGFCKGWVSMYPEECAFPSHFINKSQGTFFPQALFAPPLSVGVV